MINSAISHIDRTALAYFMKAFCAHGTLEINSPEQACSFVLEMHNFLRRLRLQTEKVLETELLTQMKVSVHLPPSTTNDLND